MATADPGPEYKCLSCTLPYKEPRLLPCGHTFCCRCLTKYIKLEQVTKDEDRHYFPCPICEAPITPDDANVDVSTWATCFPTNDLFVGLTEQTSTVHECASCLRGNESHHANVRCIDCDEQLCKQCEISHKRNKASASHKLVSSFENAGEFRDLTVYETCNKHNGKKLDVYCIDHSVMCCSICVSVSHRQCNDVRPIEEVIKKTKFNGDTAWKELTEEMRKISLEADLAITTLNAKERDFSAKMNDKIQKAKDNLDSLNAEFQHNLAKKCQAHTEKLSFRRKHVNLFRINAENSHLLMSRSNQRLSDHSRFFLREHTQNQISSHHRRLDKNNKNEPHGFDITLKIDKRIDEIVGMTTVGNVDVSSTHSTVLQNAELRVGTLIAAMRSTPLSTTVADSSSTSDITRSLQDCAVQITSAVDVWTGSVSCERKVNSSTLGGVKTPWLNGGIFIDSDKLLITDRNNNRLLMFDDTYSYLREYKLSDRPTDIARGHTADEIFVVVGENQIQRCTLHNNQLSVTNKISTARGTLGITLLGDSILVGTSESVKILSPDGKVTKSIKKKGYNTYLAVSTTKSMLHHRDGNDVVCRGLYNGEVVYRYSDLGLKGPRGIGLDQDSNVYVCGHHSGNVYIISPDRSRGKVLLPKLSDITHPWCIVVHPTKQEFLVTSSKGSTALEVYRFIDNK
ncbi:uncharacterized protein LOC117331196 [Pecten maximus]|uniref:uncharacterized protein LOC117331196 n=1 Tax=Pecten maximus TaxID=6579 RepID=UPI001458F218|nr:uncharacterized protein LOC117331196 [Pecten maximus]